MKENCSPSSHIFTVSEFAHTARELLESHFATIWVEGEISNFVCPNSGHWYFSLKDTQSQVRSAMFRMHNRTLKFLPENGMHVIVRAKVSLYEARGDFQLIVEQLEEVGLGALQRAFEQLKAKLEKKGLFAAEKKTAVPPFPQTIGIITSPTGAAIRDILNVLKRRAPHLSIIIYPTLVQGEQAAKQIKDAIKTANQHSKCDTLILARGGGSLEDLYPFNEEIVAHAIFDSAIPIVTGIGHEIDFTIADFVADQRAPTPSAAAELTSPDQTTLLQSLHHYSQRLHQSITQEFNQKKRALNELLKRVERCHPLKKLQNDAQRLDSLERRLLQAQSQKLENKKMQLNTLSAKLSSHHPKHLLTQVQTRLNHLEKQLQTTITQHLLKKQQHLKTLGRALHAVSPLATLERGYAIATNQKGEVLRKAKNIKVNDIIDVKLHQDKLHCTVKSIS